MDTPLDETARSEGDTVQVKSPREQPAEGVTSLNNRIPQQGCSFLLHSYYKLDNECPFYLLYYYQNTTTNSHPITPKQTPEGQLLVEIFAQITNNTNGI